MCVRWCMEKLQALWLNSYWLRWLNPYFCYNFIRFQILGSFLFIICSNYYCCWREDREWWSSSLLMLLHSWHMKTTNNSHQTWGIYGIIGNSPRYSCKVKIIQCQNPSNGSTNPLTKENICHSDRTVHCLMKTNMGNAF